MAYTVESRTSSPATLLREALDEAERRVILVDQNNVENLLVLLDSIERMFDELGPTMDVRGEEVRWQNLLNRLSSQPGPIASAAAKVGGYAALRAKHPPAESFWWRLDAEVSSRRRKLITRTVTIAAVVLGSIALVLWLFNTFFPPNPEAVLLVSTTGEIGQYVQDGDWRSALTVANESLKQLPNEPELLVWRTVLLERLGDTAGATATLDHARRVTSDQPIQLLLMLSQTRFQVNDLDGAEKAALEASNLNPNEAQVYFMLGNVAEARGDIPKAIEMLDKTFKLAENDNVQLAVIAKVRLGTLLQRPMGFDATPTPAESPTPAP
jgi:tetratricopeptide (TPR) repeat protein